MLLNQRPHSITQLFYKSIKKVFLKHFHRDQVKALKELILDQVFNSGGCGKNIRRGQTCPDFLSAFKSLLLMLFLNQR